MDSREHLEQELKPEPIAGPAFGAVLLHVALAGVVLAWGFLGGYFHRSSWGGSGGGGAIQVTLVSNALPLPNDQLLNKNVLATETPSQAPAEQATKTKQAVDETAIAIQGKQKKTQQQTSVRTPPKPPQPQPDNRAKYGEQTGSSTARSTQQVGAGPVSITNGDFGSRFPWYVDAINRNVSQNWYRQEVDPRTPHGTRVYLLFTIRRDGSPTGVKIDRSSGAATLDRSCMRAVQRVDTFGNLPAAYKDSTIPVSYYCEY